MRKGLRPISSRIIVLVDKEKELKVGSIVLPKNLSDKDYKTFESGIVLEIGEHAFDYLDKCPIKKRDRVFFTKYAGINMGTFEHLKNEGNSKNLSLRLRVLKDDDVQAVESETNWIPEGSSWMEILDTEEESILKNLISKGEVDNVKS